MLLSRDYLGLKEECSELQYCIVLGMLSKGEKQINTPKSSVTNAVIYRTENWLSVPYVIISSKVIGLSTRPVNSLDAISMVQTSIQ